MIINSFFLGSYLPCVILIGSPLLIKGLTIWLKLYNHFKPKPDRIKSTSEIDNQHTYRFKHKNSDSKLKTQYLSFYSIGMALLLSHFFGYLFTYSGVLLSKTGLILFGFTTKMSIYVGYFFFFVMTLNVTYFFRFSEVELDVLNIVALLELATLLLMMALHNFSLSLVLAIVYVPFTCFISPKINW